MLKTYRVHVSIPTLGVSYWTVVRAHTHRHAVSIAARAESAGMSNIMEEAKIKSVLLKTR
jgi:hypothetical protein